MNPVFELLNAPKRLAEVKLGEQVLDCKQYAWDGITLWLNVSFSQSTTLRLKFTEPDEAKPSSKLQKTVLSK